MPRPKGSKNKKTLEKEAAEAARKAQEVAASAPPEMPPSVTEKPPETPKAPDEPRHADTIARRAKLLSLCEGAVAKDGEEFAVLLAEVQRVVPTATAQQVRFDVARLLQLGWIEQRGGADKPRFMLTMRGEHLSSASGATWHGLASKSLVGEEPEKAPELPPEPPAAAGAPAWVEVARASKEREDAERVEEAAKKKRGKRKDEPDPQLSIAETPGAFKMELPCPVGLEELGALVDEHVAAADAITALEDEKSEAMAAFAKRRKTLEGNEATLREKVREARKGRLFRAVECKKVVDGSTVRVIRLDTHEVVEETPATKEELEDPITPDGSTAPAEGVEIRGDEPANDGPVEDPADADGSEPPDSFEDDPGFTELHDPLEDEDDDDDG